VADPVDEERLIAAWEAALRERGLRVQWSEQPVPHARWSADAVAPDGTVASNGMGRDRGEALEVLIWNVFGFDPALPPASRPADVAPPKGRLHG
jgi:hypothetical protein